MGQGVEPTPDPADSFRSNERKDNRRVACKCYTLKTSPQERERDKDRERKRKGNPWHKDKARPARSRAQLCYGAGRAQRNALMVQESVQLEK